VWGVDSNIEWAKKTGSMFESTEEDYINALNTAAVWGNFDIVVIDGLWRDQCTEKALQHLKPGGYLIIDNYKQKSADLEHWPLTEKLIEGMEVMYFKEPDHQDWVTIVVKK
jgi:predicted O-methyltransferase YrrM